MEDPSVSRAPSPWKVLALPFFANLLNFFDRTIPAILNEPIQASSGG